MKPDKQTYWFPAKRFGWGWGLPTQWQGWAVLCLFALLLMTGGLLLLPRHHTLLFLTYALVLCALLTGICWMTGEPPGGGAENRQAG